MAKLLTEAGTTFAVPLSDGSWVIGQILDWMNPHIFRSVIFGFRYPSSTAALGAALNGQKIIGRAAIRKTALASKRWPIGSVWPIEFPQEKWPNEQTKSSGWIDSVVYDSELLEDFVNAYFGLAYWDDWHDPNFLDEFLLEPNSRPATLIFKPKI